MSQQSITSNAGQALRLWRLSRTLAVLVAVSVNGLSAQAQGDGSSWIDPGTHTKTIYPAAYVSVHRTPTTVVMSSAEVDTDTKVIWPKALNETEKATVARRLLPQAFEASASQRLEAVTRSSRATPLMLKTLVQAAERFQVDAYLIKAVIHAESAFNPRARSPKNAIGLMQVLPGTARDLGLSAQPTASVEKLLTDPRVSIVVGTKYLAEQLERFGGNVELAVAAYNAGPGAVIKAGNKVPPYAETQAYVQRVMSLARSYRQRQTLQEVQS
ncbi:lytic transglycosylase domain-containing protein [Hydrogenophaga sp.]|uniref:lytic transglycosylase domain-containing protein n=1 Tax=Hydrogenophaga sp. TaxID=1904254 RepID=UPI003BAE7C40